MVGRFSRRADGSLVLQGGVGPCLITTETLEAAMKVRIQFMVTLPPSWATVLRFAALSGLSVASQFWWLATWPGIRWAVWLLGILRY